MIPVYKKVLEMESVALQKLEKDKKALEKIRKVLYQDENFIIEKLIEYLKRETGNEYFKYSVTDIDGNIAELIIKKNSDIFNENINNKDFLNFNSEELIDKRMFDNKDEIIILDLNVDENLINLGYLCESLDYHFLSYSDTLKSNLATFVNYVINKNL